MPSSAAAAAAAGYGPPLVGGDYAGYPPPLDSYRAHSPVTDADYERLRAAGIGPYSQPGYAELDPSLMQLGGAGPGSQFRGPAASGNPDERFVRWRDPDLHEVIDFLNHQNNMVKANACAYLQHLCYMDNNVKQKTRALGGIPPLVQLVGHDSPDVHRNACGALRNLSYGRQNDENKKCILTAGGVPILVRLLSTTPDNEARELVAGTLWNLSSSEELKRPIIDDALAVLVNQIIIPCSGWDARVGGGVAPSSYPDLYLSTVFRNATGVLRNVSSAGEYARKKLRECDGLVDSLLYVVKSAIGRANIDNRSVENCVCILRNLSYRCQEVEDPNYDKSPPPSTAAASGGQSRASASKNEENARCFGGNKKKKDASGGKSGMQRDASGPIHPQRNENVRGMELLWQPEVVQPYLSLLSDCSNPETLEASAGAIQNLSACYWQQSLDIRAAVRKEKGLPILVELLRMEVDRVVCAVATALRNLAIDERNKELIGKYAMRDLVQKLPSGNAQQDHGTSDDTISAVLATLNEVIKKNADFARSFYECAGVDRLVNITRQRSKYNAKVMKFAGQVLFTMWQHQELREVYKGGKWKESDFVTKTVAAQKNVTSSANSHGAAGANSTLNRPMASQGGTRYEDRTIQRRPPQQQQQAANSQQAGNGAGYAAHGGGGGEPLYAQVDREKKKHRLLEAAGAGPQQPGFYGQQGAAPPYEAGVGEGIMRDGRAAGPPDPAGDSWV